MTLRPLAKSALRIATATLVIYVLLVVIVFFCQRSLLFFPTHHIPNTTLKPWLDGKRIVGYCHEVANPRAIWLMTHGNGGQASDRDYVLPRMSDQDSLYVLEYPGYGSREGNPCLETINHAASEAYHLLRSSYTNIPVCVLGESIGSGPACTLARERIPPDKIVLVVPFDTIASVGSERFSFLPVRLLLRDPWNNVESLRHYAAPVDIFGAANDAIIPISHAKLLAKQIPNAHFTEISGGHNDWSMNENVKVSR